MCFGCVEDSFIQCRKNHKDFLMDILYWSSITYEYGKYDNNYNHIYGLLIASIKKIINRGGIYCRYYNYTTSKFTHLTSEDDILAFILLNRWTLNHIFNIKLKESNLLLLSSLSNKFSENYESLLDLPEELSDIIYHYNGYDFSKVEPDMNLGIYSFRIRNNKDLVTFDSIEELFGIPSKKIPSKNIIKIDNIY
jgi:hypothetical protein